MWFDYQKWSTDATQTLSDDTRLLWLRKYAEMSGWVLEEQLKRQKITLTTQPEPNNMSRLYDGNSREKTNLWYSSQDRPSRNRGLHRHLIRTKIKTNRYSHLQQWQKHWEIRLCCTRCHWCCQCTMRRSHEVIIKYETFLTFLQAFTLKHFKF